MSKLEVHLGRARAYREDSGRARDPGSQVELWFLSAYQFIEACAATHRLHIQQHQKVPGELKRNRTVFGDRTAEVIEAFQFLDSTARAKFVYSASGTKADFDRARRYFEAIAVICEGRLK
jgi:hypothetical protein